MKPLDARDAGLGDRDPRDANRDPNKDAAQRAAQAAEAEPAQAAQEPATRMVGGGRALQSAAPQGNPVLADALGKMERVKDGDAPAVLFDRMNRAEGQPRAEKRGKNW